jgi:cytochrome c oxidase subunit 2
VRPSATVPVVVLTGLILWGLFSWNELWTQGTDDDPLIVARLPVWLEVRYSGADKTLGDAVHVT